MNSPHFPTSVLQPCPLIIGTMARRGDDRSARIDIYRHAIELGLRTFDTAPLYGFGVAETLLGEAIADFPRQDLLILGKVGLRWDAGDHGEVLFEFEDANGGRQAVRRNSRPESIRREVERSLERLGTDYLDLVQIHHPDPLTPIGETLGALEALVHEGKVRHIGVSNFSLAQIRAAQAALRDVALCSFQGDYSLLQRDAEREILPHCQASGLLFLAYSPLAGGHLARGAPRAAADRNRPLQKAMAETLLPLAERYRTHPTAVVLAWLRARPGVTAAITGVSTLEQLEEQAVSLRVSLTAHDISDLERAFAGIRVVEPGRSRLRHLYGRGRRLAGRALRALGVDPGRLRRAQSWPRD